MSNGCRLLEEERPTLRHQLSFLPYNYTLAHSKGVILMFKIKACGYGYIMAKHGNKPVRIMYK